MTLRQSARMLEARQSDQWEHTSAIWFGLRLLQMTVISMVSKDAKLEELDPYEIHPFKTKPSQAPTKDNPSGYANDWIDGCRHINGFSLDLRPQMRRELAERLAAKYGGSA